MRIAKSDDEIKLAVDAVAVRIRRDHHKFTAVVVLSSGFVFASDLIRACDGHVLDVKYVHHCDPVGFAWSDITGDVIVIDDSCAGGGTWEAISENLPQSAKLCVLFRVENRATKHRKVQPDYCLFDSSTIALCGIGVDFHDPSLRSSPNLLEAKPDQEPIERIPSEWIGVDFDETLEGADGKPIKPMCDKVREFLKNGENVRIFTARVSLTVNRSAALDHVRRFCVREFGQTLQITNIKNMGCKAIFDDKAQPLPV